MNFLANQNESLPGVHLLHRIACLTLGLGLAATLAAAILHNNDWAKGIACGTVLGWLNFRWLRRGMLAIVNTAGVKSENPREARETSESAAKSKGSPRATYLAALFRYALIAVAVYAIFYYLHVPLASIGLGLCALGAATITASVWEVLKPAS